MHYYSLNHKSPHVTFEEATLQGQAPDKGLYFPEYIPALPKDLIRNIQSFSKEELALIVMKPFIGESIPEQVREPVLTMIHQLCDPNPSRRGHPKNRAERGNSYSLERYVSQLDLLRRKVEFQGLKLNIKIL